MAAANIFACSPTDLRTCAFVVVTAGKCPQDGAFTGDQCGGLQIQVSDTLQQEVFRMAEHCLRMLNGTIPLLK